MCASVTRCKTTGLTLYFLIGQIEIVLRFTVARLETGIRFKGVVIFAIAMVDPGRIEVPLHGVDPDELLSAAKKSTYGEFATSVLHRVPAGFACD